jgi:hypothetical protein
MLSKCSRLKLISRNSATDKDITNRRASDS